MISHHEHTVVTSEHDAAPGSLASYTTGFGLSVIFTLVAYFLVVRHVLGGWGIVIAILSLGVVQLLVQLLFFLHLSRESKPRWNLTVFVFMTIVLLIIVIGSLWIMHNLNYHTMAPHDTDIYIQKEENISR
ncbi:MAG: cytochrome o ubiquinol oxidase subunit IV [Candidatus Saccharimonadales bacterium]